MTLTPRLMATGSRPRTQATQRGANDSEQVAQSPLIRLYILESNNFPF